MPKVDGILGEKLPLSKPDIPITDSGTAPKCVHMIPGSETTDLNRSE